MSNPDNKKLRELLNKSAPDDDFEKEALEGFGMLPSDEDAQSLKQELDQKIKHLFEKRSGNSLIVYWVAAALLLVMGLSVYFMLSGDAQPDAGQLAVAKTKSEAAERQDQPKEPEFRAVETAPAETQEEKPRRSTPVKQPQPPAIPVAQQPAGRQEMAAPGEETDKADEEVKSSATGATEREAKPAAEEWPAELEKKEVPELAEKTASKEKTKKADRKQAVAANQAADAAMPSPAAASGAFFAAHQSQNCKFANPDDEKKFAVALQTEVPNLAFTVVLMLNKSGEVTGLVWPPDKGPTAGERKKIEKLLRGKLFSCGDGSACTCTLNYVLGR